MSEKNTIHFTKMAGTGNDFLVLEAKNNIPYAMLARHMCHRRMGVGADGLLILGRSKVADYKMRIINADGSEAEMCGNGARCLISYIAAKKRTSAKIITLETLAGIIHGKAEKGSPLIRLSNPRHLETNIPLRIENREIHAHYLDTGVPHVVIFVDQLDSISVETIGPKIRYHKRFTPKGVNVNFVEQKKAGWIAVRTYERGVEAETLACGTGSAASAIITHKLAHPGQKKQNGAQINVETRSREILKITFDFIDDKIDNVWLKGKVTWIAEGEYFH